MTSLVFLGAINLETFFGPRYYSELENVENDPVNRFYEVSFVLIANREEELFAHMGRRGYSRLSSGLKIHYDAYSDDEVIPTLSERARLGLNPGVVDDDILTAIVDRSAGDARNVIRTLRQAASLASSEQTGTTSRELVERTALQVRANIRDDTITKLTDHQRVLYETLVDDGPLGRSNLYDAYYAEVDDLKS